MLIVDDRFAVDAIYEIDAMSSADDSGIKIADRIGRTLTDFDSASAEFSAGTNSSKYEPKSVYVVTVKFCIVGV